MFGINIKSNISKIDLLTQITLNLSIILFNDWIDVNDIFALSTNRIAIKKRESI